MKTSLTNHYRSHIGRSPFWMGCSILAVTFLLSLNAALAQSVISRAAHTTLTIPKGVATNYVTTVSVVIAGIVDGVDNVALSVTNAPTGASVVLNTNSFVNNGTHPVTMTVTSDGSVAQGTHELAFIATGPGAVFYRLPMPLTCSYIWGGGTTAWSTPGNWLGGVAPSAGGDVVLRNEGGLASGITTTNIVISSDVTLGSLRFAQSESTTRRHNLEVLSGATVYVSGSKGFSLLRDIKNGGQPLDVTISGGGKLVVTNAAANFAGLINEQQLATLDMRNLNDLEIDVVRIGLGDYSLYPNFYTNGYTTTGSAGNNKPGRFYSTFFFAKTNTVKASSVDANNYNDGGVRNYSLVLGNNEGQSTGSGQRCKFSLGFSNAFFMDSICIGQGSVADLNGSAPTQTGFNFTAPGSYAIFRNYAGGRMSVWTIGEGAGPVPNQNSTRGGADLSLGTIDVLVDRLYLGRDRTNVIAAQNQTVQGTLTIALGTFDVNTAYVGMQEQGNQQGTGTTSGPEGNLNVNSNATFKVNGTLHLGYTTAANITAPNSPQLCFGKLNIGSGTVMASNIVIGGVTKLSANNNIIMGGGAGGGKLIITNALGDASGRASILVATNGSQIVLHGVTVGQSSVFVTTLSMPKVGPNAVFVVPSISGYVSGNVTIPLISYVTASPNIAGLSVTPPSGLYIKSIVNNGANSTIDVTFTDVPPQVLIWRAMVNNNWDETTLNWVTQGGGLQTNFVNGDSVVFDDSASNATVVVSASVTPGQTASPTGITINNTSLNYSFSGASVLGGSTTAKSGAGSLTIDNSFDPGVTINAGSLSGVGTIGATTLRDGATMTGFSGTINAGLSASNATVLVTGTVNGGLNLQSGSLQNNGTINGPVVLADGITLNNTPAGIMNVQVPWSVLTNSTLINNGTIKHYNTANNQGLTVSGVLKGVGVITHMGTNLAPNVRVTMSPGGSLMIGNTANEITNCTIAVRLDFNAGSTTTFDVDNGSANDKIFLNGPGFTIGKVNFGASSAKGGTLFINRIAGPAFNLATTINLFDETANPTPDNAFQAIPSAVPAPAAGLVWDVSRTVTNLTVAVMGLPTLTNSITSTNISLTWPESTRGWRLERQITTLAVGLESPSTNWTTLVTGFGGAYSNANTVVDAGTNILHFRSTQPIDTTNGAVFFRLNYP